MQKRAQSEQLPSIRDEEYDDSLDLSRHGSTATDVHSPDDDEEDDDDFESGDEANSSDEPRRQRRAEIDPNTMDAETRDALKLRILNQVEFYFGDAHYPKDRFMRELASSNEHGYIDVAAVMKFKKMRRLTNFAWFVIEALQGSQLVSVNDDKSMVRRVTPLPKDYEDALTRTVLMVHPDVNVTRDQILRKYGNFGHIDQIRFLRPGDVMPGESPKSGSVTPSYPHIANSFV
jgi:hypothetical protein